MLIDFPRKLIVQLPADNTHDHAACCDKARNCYQEGLNVLPDFFFLKLWYIRPSHSEAVFRFQSVCGVVNLVHLNSSVDKKGKVENADSNDLNGILQAKGVVTEYNQEDHGKNEEGEVCRNRPGLSLREILLIQRKILSDSEVVLDDINFEVLLKGRKDVSA